MDSYERFVRGGLELEGIPVKELDLVVMRGADAIYGPELRALAAADLRGAWAEVPLDPGRPPEEL